MKGGLETRNFTDGTEKADIMGRVPEGGLAAAGLGEYIRSSYSMASGDCVEVAQFPGGQIALRDSKNPKGGTLHFDRAEWGSFLETIV